MGTRRRNGIYALTMTAAVAAGIAVLAPWSVPLGPVPLSLCTLMIYLAAWLLTPTRALAAVAVYVLLGAAGLPVFAGFLGGLSRLAGPAGGFIFGYLPLSVICALFVCRFPNRRGPALLGLALGTAVLYGLGTVWFCAQTGSGAVEAAAVCVLPFLPGDGVKMGAALLLGPVLRRRLERTGLLVK